LDLISWRLEPHYYGCRLLILDHVMSGSCSGEVEV
jgi:hypothetical protein